MTSYQYKTPNEILESIAKTGYCVAAANPAEYQELKKQLRNCVSYSSLKRFAQSPYLYKWKLDRGEDEPTQAMRIGSAADCLALTPEYYEARYRIVERVAASNNVAAALEILKKGLEVTPERKQVRLKTNGEPYANGEQDPAQKAAWEARRARGETIFTPEDVEEAYQILEDKRNSVTRITETENTTAVQIAKAVAAALKHYGLDAAQKQVAVWCRLDHVGKVKLSQPVTLCGMADLWDAERNTIVDLKTSALNIFRARKLAFSMDDLGYNLQAGVYALLYKVATGRQLDEFSDLFVSTAEPHFDRLMVMDRQAVSEVETQVMELLVELDKCAAANNFGTPHLDRADYLLEKTKTTAIYEI